MLLTSPSWLSIATTFLALLSTLASCHTVITYPGWRGDNLHSNGSITGLNGTQFPSDIIGNGGLGVGDNNTYPYGMQWIYPCGGMPMSTNRTKWPVGGGAIGLQPGWFNGHANALFYINLGDGTVPDNYSRPMQTVFAIVGPSNELYDGSICLLQVPLPVNYTAVVGQNATIQVIETAQHGAALYNCVDITFAENDDPEIQKVTPDNCFNSTTISFQDVYYTNLSSAATPMLASRCTPWLATIPLVAALAAAMMI